MSKSIIGEKHLISLKNESLKRERTYKRIVLFEKHIQSFDINTYVEDSYRNFVDLNIDENNLNYINVYPEDDHYE